MLYISVYISVRAWFSYNASRGVAFTTSLILTIKPNPSSSSPHLDPDTTRWRRIQTPSGTNPMLIAVTKTQTLIHLKSKLNPNSNQSKANPSLNPPSTDRIATMIPPKMLSSENLWLHTPKWFDLDWPWVWSWFWSLPSLFTLSTSASL